MVIENIKLLRAVTAGISVLFGSENTGHAIYNLLQKIGEELNINSAFVMVDGNIELFDLESMLLHVWCHPSKPQPCSFQSISRASYFNYKECLQKTGAFEVIAGDVNSLNDSVLRSELVGAGVHSYIHFPIVIDQQCRGIFSMHCAHESMALGIDQQEAMREIASLVGLRFKLDQQFNETWTLREGLEMAIDNDEDIFVVFNEQGKATYLSSASESILGYNPVALKGKDLAEFVHFDDLIKFKETEITKRLLEGHTIRLRFRAMHAEGHWIWFESAVTVLPNELKRLQGYVAVVRLLRTAELTDHTTATFGEVELIRAAKYWRDVKAGVVYMPPTVIDVNSESEEAFLLDAPVEHYIERVKRQVSQLETLLNSVPWIDRAEQNQIVTSKTRIDIKSWAKEMQKLFFSHQKDGRVLNVVLPEEEVFVDINELVLLDVFVNLLDNAFKYSQNCKAPTLQIKLLGKGVLFEVQDEGIGIPAGDQKKLYQLYFRASNVGAITGTGLGLATVKRLVTSVGGSISYVTQMKAGTTFSVYLPQAQS